MPENDRLSGCLDEINLGFVEREATPPLLMKLSIQLDDEQYWLYAAVFAATGAHRRSPRGSIRGIGGRRRPPIGDLLRYCFGGDFLIPESRVFRRFVRLTACFRVGEEPAGIDMGPAGFEPDVSNADWLTSSAGRLPLRRRSGLEPIAPIPRLGVLRRATNGRTRTHRSRRRERDVPRTTA